MAVPESKINEAIREPVCYSCKNFAGFSTCNAFFPNKIPEDIILGRNDHTKPYEGDNGIQYEKSETA